MITLSKKDIEELRDLCSSGCYYSGTKEIINDITTYILSDFGCALTSPDEIGIDGSKYTLDDFIIRFWDAAVTCVLDAVETYKDS